MIMRKYDNRRFFFRPPFARGVAAVRLFVMAFFLLPVVAPVAAQRLTFDGDWRFRLCRDTADVGACLRSLGIAENPSAYTQNSSIINKVTDDTEPEQAQAASDNEAEHAVVHVDANRNVASSRSVDGFTAVTVPHDWSIELPFVPSVGGSAGYLPGGQGIYVKDFTLPKSFASRNKKYLLQFDGVYHRATVWVNGHNLGHHVYGYTGFEYDVTPYLSSYGQNRIVVHVNREEQSRWYTGSGIYRHVWLNVVNPTHIKTNGVCVSATLSPDGSATVRATAEAVVAPSDSEHRFTFTYTLLYNDGQKTRRQPLSAGGTLTISRPRLWSLSDPYRYVLRTQLKDSRGRVVDQNDTYFGIREARFDADKGFFLNGENIKLKGMCLHQDMGSLGVAVPDQAWERRLRTLKDIGCNAIRCSHNPPSPEFLTICDTLGLLVIDEAFDKWKSGYYAPFFDSCARQDITDMVLRDRNHPSVIVWSIGNEVQEAWDKGDEGVQRARMLHDLVKSLDPTRPTMVACQQGFQDKFGDVTDLVGYNYLEPRMIADHKRHPHRKMLVTEAFVYYSGLREDIVRDFVERNPWHFVEDNDFIAGSFVWAGVDYLGESSPWPAKGWCSCPFDMTLKERPQAAFYHPAWQPERDYLKLMVRDNCLDQAMGTDHWQYPPMADTWDLPYQDSRCVEVRCYTTCDSVQFFFPMWSNPRLPLKHRVTSRYPDRCITVQLPYRQGKILAVGYKDGRPVLRDSLENHGPVAAVRLDTDNLTLKALQSDMTATAASGPQLAHIRLTLTDSLGRVQQMQPRRFSVSTEGPIRLLGVETGDMRRHDSWRTTSLPTYFGEGFIRLQSTRQTGTARVIINVEGFGTPFVQEIRITE